MFILYKLSGALASTAGQKNFTFEITDYDFAIAFFSFTRYYLRCLRAGFLMANLLVTAVSPAVPTAIVAVGTP